MDLIKSGYWSCFGCLTGLLLAAGCDSRPKAPALRDSAVFHSKQEGFRFLVPEGWKQSANGVLPPGKLEGEVLMTSFRMPTSQAGATLDVLCFDATQHSDLYLYHSSPSNSVQTWTTVEKPETIDVNQTPAERFILSGSYGKQEMVKEVVSFRKRGRVYSFIGLFAASDHSAREEMRRAIGSIVWER